MDTLRNELYDVYRPQIKMVEELQINDGPADIVHPFVATKKVTQVRVAPVALPQDNQVEIVPIERDAKEIVIPNLPPSGPLVKAVPDVDSIVYVMKNPLLPWQKAKVCTRCSAQRACFLVYRYSWLIKTWFYNLLTGV